MFGFHCNEGQCHFYTSELKLDMTVNYYIVCTIPSLPSTIPYMSARIIKSELTYSFKVPGKTRHWIRLHFYPTNYETYLSNNAYFSVVADGVTLLKNFNSSITALALTQSHILREYSLYPSGEVLNITFTPSPDHKDSYAFVNGIEVISMPDLFKRAIMVGFGEESVNTKSSVLQTMYRLNVGGQFISQLRTLGLLDNGMTTALIYNGNLGMIPDIEANRKILYPKDLTGYVAPS
ncbi:hypothetical protein IFM89_021300 [Coptis chinensis]|uniref:Malectin-like domain-containing protein n=1 Tax=Coptis chinensis TaxID=261450 RepID=A0A835HWD7_9MAGN|nr:hypothetical protein IFM89_021300 [Coptis chinensis]